MESLVQKCTQCDNNAIQQYGDNYLCLKCLERLSDIHHRDNEQRHREMMYNMQLANAAEQQINDVVGIPGKPSFDLSVFQPPRNIKMSTVNVNKSVVGNISTEEVGNIQVSLEKINAGGNSDTAIKLHDLTEALLSADSIDITKKNETLEQISMLSEQAALPKANRKGGIIRAAAAAIKETASTVTSVATAWQKIEPIIDQLV